ncbi:MAG: hypothetical protein OEY63_00340, partial [Gemmatimonadota bacterium]|nr:hypothetical protein [Gemmatimonadota bacterium]
LSGAGALQLMPGILGVCFPTRRVLSKTGVIAGMVTGLTTLYLTLQVWPHPLGLHGGVWSVIANGVVTVVLSRFTAPPSPATISRIHGTMEQFVYGNNDERQDI